MGELLSNNAGTLAVLTAIVGACLEVSLRASQRLGDRSWAIGFIGSWAGALVLFPFCLSSLPQFSQEIFLLFLGQGVFWSLAVFFEFKSMAFVDASSNVIMSSLRTVILAIAGWLIFGEVWSVAEGWGAALVVIGTLVALPPYVFTRPKGVLLRLSSVLAGAAAIVCDKFLIDQAGFAWALVMSYFTPGVLFAFMRSRDWRAEIAGIRGESIRPFALVIALYVLIGPLMLGAFGFGEVGSTFVISQARIVMVLAMSSLLLGENDYLPRRWLGALIVLAGVGFLV